MHVCVVVRTYQAELSSSLPALLASLISAAEAVAPTEASFGGSSSSGSSSSSSSSSTSGSTTSPAASCRINVTADVLPTDSTEEAAEATRRAVSQLVGQPTFAARPFFRVVPHPRASNPAREAFWRARCGARPIGTCGPSGDCGYLQTDLTLEHATLSRAGDDACDYVMVTNGDNLYAKSLFRRTCPHMMPPSAPVARRLSSHSHQQRGAGHLTGGGARDDHGGGGGKGLIGFHFASHYSYSHVYVAQGRVERSGPDVLFKTRLTKGWCDLGSLLIRADLLRSHVDQQPGYHYVDCGPWRESDGRLISRLAKTNTTRVVLDRILFVHQ